MPRDSAAADRPASYLVGTAAAFPLFFRDRTKPINQLPFSPSAKFPKSGSSCESRASDRITYSCRSHFLRLCRVPSMERDDRCESTPNRRPLAIGATTLKANNQRFGGVPIGADRDP